jgi:uncharacterized protein (TIGR00369 family)
MSDRSRAYEWVDPVAFVHAAADRSGLELMRAIADGGLPQAPISATLGFHLVEVEEGSAVFEGEPGEYLYNPIGTVHAGYSTTLLDSAMGCALATTLPAGTPWTTLELKANFTRPLTVESGVVRCTGSVVHAGRRVATTQAHLHDGAGRLCAHALSTILIDR